MEVKFCQSCGMPMNNSTELYGTEKDGSKSADYCSYCYEKGEFNFHGSMDEMIEMCVAPMVEHNPSMTNEGAREMMQKFFPMLKRWKA
ncbi:zinc ribbon domain-containing protein [Oscillospiraceae bacterium MB08-C2-2]|nr:zinc ribbon domain-containing protein [Oscillospiraceae bacterium MB08-C2-2]